MNPTPQQAFAQGLTHIFDAWTALTLAVDHGWGGRGGREKKQAFIDETLELFACRRLKGNDEQALADYLQASMERLFFIGEAEDDYTEVSRLLCELHTTLAAGDYKHFQRIMQHTADGASRSIGTSTANAGDLLGVPGASLYERQGNDGQVDERQSEEEGEDEGEDGDEGFAKEEELTATVTT